MGEDPPDIVAAGAEDGEDRVADAPFSGDLATQPSLFMCPISGAIALRRLRSFARSGVMPRLVPADQDLGGLHAMAAIAAINHSQSRHVVGQDGNLLQCGARVWPSYGFPGKLRAPTTKPPSRVAARLTLVPNSQRMRALLLEMQSTSGSCRAWRGVA
jgi:hypothetical protein